MTESTFLKGLEWLKDETVDAIIVYNAYEELNRLLERNYIREAMMPEGDFWQMQLAVLQQVLFTTLGRIFDKQGDSHSVSKVLDNAIRHPEFFSREALARRKTAGSSVKPEWLDDFIAASWDFDKRAFETLKNELKPHEAAYRTIYEPLRHRHYAHRRLNPNQPVADLFAQTNRAELGRTLLFLRDVAETIGQTFVNGKPLTLGQSDYMPDRIQIRSAIRGVLGKIVLYQLSSLKVRTPGSEYVDQSSPR